VVKISAQSEHFYVLVLQVGHSKFWLFKPIFRHLDPDPGFRPKLNADPAGSESETLLSTIDRVSAIKTTTAFMVDRLEFANLGLPSSQAQAEVPYLTQSSSYSGT
jgi:hypothetical protein